MFVDRVKVQCRAGSGGNGIIAWRREKFVPKGGPAGGDGGNGGSIIFEADHNVAALDWFTYKSILRAEDGAVGGTNNKQGADGEDLHVKIPPGTILKDVKTGETLFDFLEHGKQFVVCSGGKGGRGNHAFRSSTNRSPRIATKGTPGEELNIELELKLIADVGLIGLPNAGKSTLIKKLTDVAVKISSYPFTTLSPNLGYLYGEDGKKVLLADIPGIIEGAHENRGLGFEFLRHIERTRVLIYVIDAASPDGKTPREHLAILRGELGAYNDELLQKPALVVLNKCDLEEAAHNICQFQSQESCFVISAERGDGIDELKKVILA
jgi:GTP-binding protein